jgi:hypothetical protein
MDALDRPIDEECLWQREEALGETWEEELALSRYYYFYYYYY